MSQMGEPKKKWIFNERSTEVESYNLRQHPDNKGWYGGKEYIADENAAFDSALECLSAQQTKYEDLIDVIKKKKFKYM